MKARAVKASLMNSESSDRLERVRASCAVPLLQGTSSEVIDKLAGLMERIEIDMLGHCLISQGLPPSRFYILTQGEVEVVLDSGHIVASLSANANEALERCPFFGEIGMLTGAPAMASVRCSTACIVLGVSHTNFSEFLKVVPDLTQRVKAIADLRARQNEFMFARQQRQKELVRQRMEGVRIRRGRGRGRGRGALRGRRRQVRLAASRRADDLPCARRRQLGRG